MRALTFIVLLLLSPTARADTDPRQAAAAAVAVLEDAEIRRASVTKWESYQKHFEDQCRFGPDMAVSLHGVSAVVGSLAHGHFNCSLRNLLARQKGCQCLDWTKECGCRGAPILDAKGCYDPAAVAARDLAWSTLTLQGINYELSLIHI